MARGRKPRTWVRLDCEGILRGSINYLLPLEGQAVWVKMIALSEVCGGRSGYIEDNNHNGLPIEYVAQELHCSVEQFQAVLDKMGGDGAIKVNGSGSIQLVNFRHYQFSEYDRQKVYRQKAGDNTQTFEEYIEAIRPEYSDLDIDNELKKFYLWWGEGKRELKRPKLAFKNWLDKARIIKSEQGEKRGTDRQSAGKDDKGEYPPGTNRFTGGKYGRAVQQ